MLVVIFALVFLNLVDCTLEWSLSDEEYYQLPKVFELDDFERCRATTDALYCAGTFALRENNRSKLFQTLKNLSNQRQNFNHTQVHRGFCITTRNCTTDTSSYENQFANCVNESLFNEYGLGTTLLEFDYCSSSGGKKNLDLVDGLFICTTIVLVLLNVICSVGHFVARWRGVKEVNNWFLVFSVMHNFENLTSLKNQDAKKFASISGMKAMTMFLVILSHVTLIPMFGFIENTRFVELDLQCFEGMFDITLSALFRTWMAGQHNPHRIFQRLLRTNRYYPNKLEATIMFNGALIIQTYFVIGAFLLTYNLLLSYGGDQGNTFTHWKLLQGIVTRYLRMTPTYMWMIFFVSTMTEYFGEGPQFHRIVEQEMKGCRSKWWIQAVYLQNVLKPDEKCLAQCWYLAADLQLYVIGLILMIFLLKNRRMIKLILPGFLTITIIAQFFIAYYFELQPFVSIQTPELLRTTYKGEKTWSLLYSTAIGNLPGYLIGMMLAYIFYNIERKQIVIKDNKMFIIVYHLTGPLGLAVIMSSRIFLNQQQPVWLTSLYAALDRSIFAVIAAIIMLGNIVRIESPIRVICEWRGFRVLGRLTLCALLIHSSVLRIVYGTRKQTIHITVADSLLDWIGCVALTFLLAVPMAVLIEYPFIQLQKMLVYKRPSNPVIDENRNGLNK